MIVGKTTTEAKGNSRSSLACNHFFASPSSEQALAKLALASAFLKLERLKNENNL